MQLPSWLDQETWTAFCAMRRKMRNVPFTEHAERLILRKLEQFRDWGYDPNESLQESIMRGWRGVFPQGEPIRKETRRTGPYMGASADDRAYYEKFYKEHPELLRSYKEPS